MDLTDTGTELVTLLTRLADGAENTDPLLDEVMKGWMEVVHTVGAQEIGELICEQTGAAPDADAVAHLDEWLTTLPELAKDEEAMTDYLMQISEDFGLSLDEETARLAATCLERLYR